MCERCKKKEDEYLMRTIKNNLIVTELLCKECFDSDMVDEV